MDTTTNASPMISCEEALSLTEAELNALIGHLKRWAADDCTGDPPLHGQQHNVLGQPTGCCAVCEMSWPCPSAVLVENGWYDPDDGEV